MATTLNISDILGIDGNPEDWNWKENFVQADENMGTPGTFIAAESTLIAFGPAKASDAFSVTKVGLTPNISISQNIPQQRLPEIGSVRVHILNGVPVGGGSMSRLIYNGPSIFRMAYGRLFDDSGNPTTLAINGMIERDGTAQSYIAGTWQRITQNQSKIIQGDNQTHLWLSAWDERLRMPTGVAIYFQDVSGNSVGGVYCEGTKFNSHNFTQSAGQLIMVEGVTFAFDRLIPIVGIGSQY